MLIGPASISISRTIVVCMCVKTTLQQVKVPVLGSEGFCLLNWLLCRLLFIWYGAVFFFNLLVTISSTNKETSIAANRARMKCLQSCEVFRDELHAINVILQHLKSGNTVSLLCPITLLYLDIRTMDSSVIMVENEES